jgi:hypothetical protein
MENESPDQTMQPTAGRRTASLLMTKTRSFQAICALNLNRSYSQLERVQPKETMISSPLAQKYTILIASIAILTVGAIVPQYSLASVGEQQNVIHQLRIYEIFDSNKKAFHDRFRDHAMRIMAKYDFKIVATWESKKDNQTEFIYLLEWPDKETMTDRWEKFLHDQEWIKIKKETGEVYGPLVGEIQDRTLYLTDYSPRQTLAK